MDEYELKLRCYDRAVSEGFRGKEALDYAETIYNWVRGRKSHEANVHLADHVKE